MMQELTLNQIKALFPNEWVLIGNPILDEPEVESSIISQLISGVVIFHSKDKREIVYHTKEEKKNYETTTLIYTGEIPKGRKFWL